MSKIIKLKPGSNDFEAAREASECLKNGGVILYPTDTVYGLGCDAWNEKSIGRIFRIKKRSVSNPALILIPSMSMLGEIVSEIGPSAAQLMKKFWPGPLTLLFQPKIGLPGLLVSANFKVGIRFPDNQFCISLMEQLERPIVSTSANLSGVPAPDKMSDLISFFSEKVDLIVDGGDSTGMLPSTVLDVSGKIPVVIREGAIKTSEFDNIIV